MNPSTLVILSSIIMGLESSLANGDDGETWVVLVAGSNGYFNYRHQADVCHAYQVVHNHGVPDDRIIVMMYDDIANSSENPRPGTIINRPDGPNVYQGVPKDYTGDDVTPENFLGVLNGSKALEMAGKKVIKSNHTIIFNKCCPIIMKFSGCQEHAVRQDLCVFYGSRRSGACWLPE